MLVNFNLPPFAALEELHGWCAKEPIYDKIGDIRRILAANVSKEDGEYLLQLLERAYTR